MRWVASTLVATAMVVVELGAQEPAPGSVVRMQRTGEHSATVSFDAPPQPTPAPEVMVDQSGWPLLDPQPQAAPAPGGAAAAVMPSSIEQAFVDLGWLTMELEITGYLPDGSEEFRRQMTVELSTRAEGGERLRFGDGRVYQRIGGMVSARLGETARPDLVDEARSWLQKVGLLLRLPNTTAFAADPAGPFVPVHGAGRPQREGMVHRRYARANERLEFLLDPATDQVTEFVYRPGQDAAARRVLLEEPQMLGGAWVPTLRTVVAPESGQQVLRLRLRSLQQAAPARTSR